MISIPLQDCFAHSLEGKPKSQWQGLVEHLRNVAERAAAFAQPFESADWASNLGWLHDLGKAAHEFQAYLERENGILDDAAYDAQGFGKVNHSSAGTALAIERFAGLAGQALAYPIAGHHAGLTDHGADTAGLGALVHRIEEGKTLLARILHATHEITPNLRACSRPPNFVKADGFHLWIRMIFSCLVDADYLDTEDFMNSEAASLRAKSRNLCEDPEIKVLFDQHMERLSQTAQPTMVNRIREEILASSRAAALCPPGIFTMSVPTGGGKTLSSMAFALEHACLHKKSRIIYVIPYTSIIEQTAEILSGIFGQENVIEHHSSLDPDKETQRSRLAAENWDAPIVVTTNVQFFESLFAAKPGRCRKLHHLVNSVVILDEAQLLPPKWLVPCVDAMNRLTADYGATIILTTATQPVLPGIQRSHEIVPDKERLFASLRRVRIEMPADLRLPRSWDEVAHDLSQHEQVLCIVNTRRDCRDLHDLMPDGTIHLSALMCGAHRSHIIAKLKAALKLDQPVRVISTQLVEAGVDIDFPVVYRALAGLDSISQAAGRCNREGKLELPGVVRVFIPPKEPPIGMMRKGADTTRELALPDFDPQSPQAFDRYFGLYYSKVNDLGKDWLKTKLQQATELQFRKAAEEFHFIDDRASRAVIVRYEESEKWIEKLRFAGPTREIMRRLQRYTVNVSTQIADRMLSAGKLERLECDILVQSMPNLYNEKMGLDVYSDHLPPEDLLV